MAINLSPTSVSRKYFSASDTITNFTRLFKLILLVALVARSPFLFSQNTLDNLGLPATAPAAAAYSLRQLSTSYTGPAIQVRRSSDNATQNIGFNGAGDLDVAALTAFVGSADGFVSVWYDQSGFGRNATQATSGQQPRIVLAGVVEFQNNKPTLVFSGGQNLLSTLTAAQATTGGNITTTSAVFRNATQNSSLFSSGDGGGNRYNIHAPWGDGNTYFDIGNIGSGGRISGSVQWNSTYSIGSFQRNGSQGNVWRNSVNVISANTFSTNVTSTSGMWIGSFNGSSFFITGSVGEIIAFPSALSTADRTILECNQSSYYTISFAAPQGIELVASGTAAASACNFVEEDVVWRLVDLVNNAASGNNLIKIQGGNNWNGG
nr:hypothetical protein [Cyclobacteriaceae bacterium]